MQVAADAHCDRQKTRASEGPSQFVNDLRKGLHVTCGWARSIRTSQHCFEQFLVTFMLVYRHVQRDREGPLKLPRSTENFVLQLVHFCLPLKPSRLVHECDGRGSR